MKELCFNLWYWLDPQQMIVAIAARSYMLRGSEDTKGSILAELSACDYELAQAVRLAKPIHYLELKQRGMGIEAIFEEELERIKRSLPKGITFPDDKLHWLTPLFDFGHGYVPALIGDGFIKERD